MIDLTPFPAIISAIQAAAPINGFDDSGNPVFDSSATDAQKAAALAILPDWKLLAAKSSAIAAIDAGFAAACAAGITCALPAGGTITLSATLDGFANLVARATGIMAARAAAQRAQGSSYSDDAFYSQQTALIDINGAVVSLSIGDCQHVLAMEYQDAYNALVLKQATLKTQITAATTPDAATAIVWTS